MEALPPRESVIIAYGTLYLIPGGVTTSVDTISGNEYATDQRIMGNKRRRFQGTPPKCYLSGNNGEATQHIPHLHQLGPQASLYHGSLRPAAQLFLHQVSPMTLSYVGSTDGYIYALDAWDGSLIWKFKTKTSRVLACSCRWLCVYGRRRRLRLLPQCLHRLLQWKTFINGNLQFTFGNLVLKSSPAVVNGTVYIGSLDGYLYAINADNGNITWKTQALGPIESSPAVADAAVYFTAEEPIFGGFYKLDAKTGNVLWKKELAYRSSFTGGNQMLGSPSLAEGMVFASSNWGDYFCFDAETGGRLWRFQDPGAVEFIVSSPIYVNDGTVLLIDKFDLACVNGSNGWVIWSKYTGDELYVSPSYADGKAYMVTSQRHIFVLDTTNNGTILAYATLPSSTWSSPTVANNRLYIGCNDWNVYCFNEPIINESSANTPSANDRFTQLPTILVTILVTSVVIAIIVLVYVLKRQTTK